MKKCILLLMLGMITLSISAQVEPKDTSYYSIEVKEQVHYQDFTLDSCFVKIRSISVSEVADLNADVSLAVYKYKSYSVENPTWIISPLEIPLNLRLPIGPLFSEGDLFIKITAGIKEYFLAINPTWNPNNLIITK